MANEGRDDHMASGMDITDQRQTFSGFMAVTVWSSLLIVMAVAGLTVAFAIGAGWLAGVGVYAVIGILGGLVLRMKSVWWGILIVSTIALAIGGGVVSGILALV